MGQKLLNHTNTHSRKENRGQITIDDMENSLFSLRLVMSNARGKLLKAENDNIHSA